MSKENKKDNEPLSKSTKRNECDKEPEVLNTQGQPSAEQVDETPSSSPDERISRQMLAAIESLATEFSDLNRTIESRLRYDKVKEEAFERLYAELEDLKKNSAFEQISPLYMDLILLFDRIENIRQDIDGSTTAPSPQKDVLKTLSDELLEILYRRGVELINTTDQTFDPSVQQAIGAQPTFSEVEKNQIDRVVRRGFRYRERIIRAEEVIIKKYSPENSSASAS
jgi:molecular chaperone GrpE (heat shock protein)